MKLFVPPLLAVSAAFAAVAGPPMAELGNLTATAMLGWYVWHTASRTIPQLIDGFRSELAAQRAQRRADCDSMVEALRQLSAKLDARAAGNPAASSAPHRCAVCNHVCFHQQGENQ